MGKNKDSIVLFVSGKKSNGKSGFICNKLIPLLKSFNMSYLSVYANSITVNGIKQASKKYDVVIVDEFEINQKGE